MLQNYINNYNYYRLTNLHSKHAKCHSAVAVAVTAQEEHLIFHSVATGKVNFPEYPVF